MSDFKMPPLPPSDAQYRQTIMHGKNRKSAATDEKESLKVTVVIAEVAIC